MLDALEHRPLSAGAAAVRNPLSVIAMFVLMVEAIATVTLTQIYQNEKVAIPIVWFVVLFPTLIAFLLFGTIWWKHQSLYSPMEYRSDASFLTAMQRLQRVEARQEAADLNPRTADEAESLQVVDRLLRLGDVRAAVKVGRTFLEARQFDVAIRIFSHILDKSPSTHVDRYNALANLGYSQIGLKKYNEAASTLDLCISIIPATKIGPWHSLAIAYCNMKMSTDPSDDFNQKYRIYLARGKKHKWFVDGRDFYQMLYPEMAKDLL